MKQIFMDYKKMMIITSIIFILLIITSIVLYTKVNDQNIESQEVNVLVK